jgi:hypothetical protein
MKWASRFTAVVAALGIAAGWARAQPVLSEIMFDPLETNDAYEEFIELYNPSSSDWLDLSAYTIGDQDAQDSLVDQGHGFWLAPLGHALILDPGYWDNSSAYDTLIDQEALLLTISDGSFGAFGLRNDPPDTVILRGSDGTIIASHGYTPDNPPGHSEEKVRLEWGDDEGNWANSLTLLGTPGFVNSVQPQSVDLAVIGLQADPSPLPWGNPVTLLATLSNSGMQWVGSGEVIFAVGPMESIIDSILGAADFSGLSPAEEKSVALQVESLPPGPQRLAAYHSLNDLNPGNDSLSIMLSVGYPENSVIINEIMARPGGEAGEWIELYNPGEMAINGYQFAFSDDDTADGVEIADSSLILPAHGYLLLCEDESIFDWDLPDEAAVIILGNDWPFLNDQGDTPTLFDAAGTVLDAVPYAGWEIPEGVSLERIYAASASNDPTNWRASLDGAHGTPGRANSFQPAPAPLAGFGSLSFSPDPFDPDRHGALQIQISLPQNATAAAVIAFDLRGRRLKIIFDDSMATGYQEILWDGRDSDDRRLPPGLYILFAEFRDASGKRQSIAKESLVIAGRL